MWNPRLYALVVCVGLLARASYHGALHELDGEYAGLAGLITFWIPLVGVLGIAVSLLMPVVRRWLQGKGCQT